MCIRLGTLVIHSTTVCSSDIVDYYHLGRDVVCWKGGHSSEKEAKQKSVEKGSTLWATQRLE